jgi:hypothetical protein
MGNILAGIPDLSRSVRNGNGHRHSPREHLRNGVCLAALRSFTGAQLYRAPDNAFTLGECALRCGSCVAYVRAALVLLQHADPKLIDIVMRGRRSILDAAASVEAEVRLTAALMAASPRARVAAARRLGVDTVWDDMVEPLISDEPISIED